MTLASNLDSISNQIRVVFVFFNNILDIIETKAWSFISTFVR